MKHTLFYFLTHPLYTFHAIRMKISDRYSIEQQWKTCMDYPLDLDNPESACEKLSEGIPHVRVDLYRHNGQLYFGEFTFYTWAGYMDFHPKKYDRILGDMFELPTRK